MHQIPLLLPSITHNLNRAGPVPPRLLKHRQPLRNLGSRDTSARQRHAKRDAVLDALGAALPLVREHRVGGVADDDHVALGPRLDGGAVEERPALNVGGLCEDGEEGGVQVGEGAEEVGFVDLGVPVWRGG